MFFVVIDTQQLYTRLRNCGAGLVVDTDQWLNDCGFTVPATGHAYWVGEAMGSVDFQDLDETPEKVTQTVQDVARNAAHLARVLQGSPYPAG